MKKGTATISIEEHDRLREIERKYNEGITEIFWESKFSSGIYTSENIKVYNADDGIIALRDKLNEVKRVAYKKKWYQFVEFKE